MLSEAGAARPPDAATDLLAAARRAVERWSAHDAELIVSGAATLVRCTAADLDRILDVLIENAIDYGPPGQRIRLVVAPGRLEVADEGPGLAPGEEETIFARFHRGTVGRASRRRGTGLGLPIARELAGRWDGDGDARQRRRAAAPWRRSCCRSTDGTTPTEPLRPHVRRSGMTGWRRNLAIAVAAVAGLVLAAALTTAASTLSGPERRALVRAVDRGSRARAGRRPQEPEAEPTRTATPRPTRTRAARTHAAHADGRSDRGAARRRSTTTTAAPAAAAATTRSGRGAAGVAVAAATTTTDRGPQATCDRPLGALERAPRADAQVLPNLSPALPVAWGVAADGVGMNLRTPVIATVAVLSALGGVAAAAIALPSTPAPPSPPPPSRPPPRPSRCRPRRSAARSTSSAKTRRSNSGGGSSSAAPRRLALLVAPGRRRSGAGSRRARPQFLEPLRRQRPPLARRRRLDDDDSDDHGGDDDDDDDDDSGRRPRSRSRR